MGSQLHPLAGRPGGTARGGQPDTFLRAGRRGSPPSAVGLRLGRSRGPTRTTHRGISSMRRVLVTGATGLVGLPLIAELARGDEEVHAITTRPAPPEVPGVRWHRADLGDDSVHDS